jgi:hypothetical protein
VKLKRLNLAFNLALRSLGLVDRIDPLIELVAIRVSKAGTDGMRDPTEIADMVVKRHGLR